jgi:hypothetical protein
VENGAPLEQGVTAQRQGKLLRNSRCEDGGKLVKGTASRQIGVATPGSGNHGKRRALSHQNSLQNIVAAQKLFLYGNNNNLFSWNMPIMF